MSARRLAPVLTAGLAIVAPASARAQAAFTPEDTVELNQGPIIAPASIVAMGGANLGIAEGAGAQQLNPAAVANRRPHNGNMWFDWDWAFDWLNVGVTEVDFENNHRPAPDADQLSVVTGALSFNFGRLGLGLTVGSQVLDFGFAAGGPGSGGSKYSAASASLSGGYAFLDGQLVFGAQLIGAFAEVRSKPQGSDDFLVMKMSGGGLGLGAIVRPIGEAYRVGVAFRSQMTLHPDSIAEDTMGVIVPKAMIVPWQLGVGASYTFGARAPNRTATFGAEDLETRTTSTATTAARPYWERAYLTAAIDLILTGATDASGFEAWTERERQSAGSSATASIRAGADAELWPDRVRGRAGVYYEPSRFEGVHGRPHFTTGFDLRLGTLIWNWKTGAAIDVSFGYVNVMLGLGFWYGNAPPPPPARGPR